MNSHQRSGVIGLVWILGVAATLAWGQRPAFSQATPAQPCRRAGRVGHRPILHGTSVSGGRRAKDRLEVYSQQRNGARFPGRRRRQQRTDAGRARKQGAGVELYSLGSASRSFARVSC